ncbi:MAG: type II toxin-antitoxin system death-on-curing family toxin [Bacteroidia bacterium]|nr:type II toxin-antitoxin system death-on-curing family toxin [Bacteroidia bacterium]
MIDLESVLEVQNTLLENYGGKSGVRDMGLLLSALNRPLSGIGEIEFFPSPQQKAAALIESIIKNHPFIDGNKRIGFVLMRLVLMQNGLDIEANQDEKFKFVIYIANGEFDYEKIYSWILNHLTR